MVDVTPLACVPSSSSLAPASSRSHSVPPHFQPNEWTNHTMRNERDNRETQNEQDGGGQDTDSSSSRYSPSASSPIGIGVGSVTVATLECAIYDDAGGARRRRTHTVRIVQIDWRELHRSTGYVHLCDLISFLCRPFERPQVQMSQADVKAKLGKDIQAIQPYMTQLSDEFIDVNLSGSSTASVSLRGLLLSSLGLRCLLHLPMIARMVTSRVNKYGATFRQFIESTIMHNLLVLNQGPQQEQGEGEELTHAENKNQSQRQLT